MIHLIWNYPVEFEYSLIFDWNYFDYFAECPLIKRRFMYEEFFEIMVFNIEEPLLYLFRKSIDILLSVNY